MQQLHAHCICNQIQINQMTNLTSYLGAAAFVEIYIVWNWYLCRT